MTVKDIAPSDRLIFALDVADADTARRLVERLDDAVTFYKLGLELAMSGDYFGLLESLVGQGKNIFADLKFYDIPATVGRAVRNLSGRGITFITVHGDRAIMEAAAENKGDVKVLAVTVLTSIDKNGLEAMGYSGAVKDLVLKRGQQAKNAGCDGLIASGQDAKMLREHLGDDVLIVTPGIRPEATGSNDDQKRIVTAEQAFRDGADHIVVGRPIREAEDPHAAAVSFQETITGLFAG